jgi:hypothetical protein
MLMMEHTNEKTILQKKQDQSDPDKQGNFPDRSD